MHVCSLCVYVQGWSERRAFAPVLLAFVLLGKVFAALADARFIHFGGPVITAKSNTFKIDCASDGSRGMLCSERRLYAFKHWWPRLLFWRFPCASLLERSREGLNSRLRCRSVLRTFSKGCKRMCFYDRNCRPYAKSTFSPVLDCQTQASEADGLLPLQEECWTLVVLLRNEFFKRRNDVVRLVWLLIRFSEDVDFSNYSDFLLRCGRFDRLCWQLVFGTFLAELDGMENDHLGTYR